MTGLEIKGALLAECQEKVNGRYQKIKQTIADLNEALEEESNSGGDDGFDNSRSMIQIDLENTTKQLGEVNVLRDVLHKIDIKSTTQYARLGSLVKANNGYYFLSLSIGNVKIGNNNYVCVALNSPIGTELKGKVKGDTFVFNQQEISVLDVY
jgi:hypothetical protein